MELEGKEIGCWCKPGPCHGDILIKLFKERKGMNSCSSISDYREFTPVSTKGGSNWDNNNNFPSSLQPDFEPYETLSDLSCKDHLSNIAETVKYDEFNALEISMSSMGSSECTSSICPSISISTHTSNQTDLAVTNFHELNEVPFAQMEVSAQESTDSLAPLFEHTHSVSVPLRLNGGTSTSLDNQENMDDIERNSILGNDPSISSVSISSVGESEASSQIRF